MFHAYFNASAKPAGRAPAVSRQILSRPQARRIDAFIEANLDGELTLAQIAGVAGMSVPHLTALFRRTMGQSVHAYVMARRVERAQALLRAGPMSIAEVAFETGFSHQSHLARWMRRLLGATPRQVVRERGAAPCRIPPPTIVSIIPRPEDEIIPRPEDEPTA